MSPSTKYWPPLSWRLFQRLLKTIDKLKIISEVAQDKRVITIYRFHKLVIDREDDQPWMSDPLKTMRQLVTALNVWSTQNYETAGYSLECLIHSKLLGSWLQPWMSDPLKTMRQLVTALNVWSTQNYEAAGYSLEWILRMLGQDSRLFQRGYWRSSKTETTTNWELENNIRV